MHVLIFDVEFDSAAQFAAEVGGSAMMLVGSLSCRAAVEVGAGGDAAGGAAGDPGVDGEGGPGGVPERQPGDTGPGPAGGGLHR